MALNATPPDIYPLATALGQPIPLAVARPKGNVHVDLLKDAVLSLVLPAATNLVTCIFDQDIDLWVVNPSTITTNVYTDGVMTLMAEVAYDLALPQAIWIVAHHYATIGHINVIETWSQLQNQTYEVS